jgi:hypothetical protein
MLLVEPFGTGEIAFTGQFFAHNPQAMHFSGFITDLPVEKFIAFTGQFGTH